MMNLELFEGLKPSMILNDVLDHVQNCLGSLSESEFQLKQVCIVGSRLRGTHHEESDLDIAISYSGSLREDDCFNELAEYPLFIEDGLIQIDFVPYSLEKGNDIDFNSPFYLLFDVDKEADQKSIAQQLIDIFWSDIPNKEVISKTYEFSMQHQEIPDSLSRYFGLMKDFLTSGTDRSAFFIIEPYGQSLEELDPAYFSKQRSIFYQEEEWVQRLAI